ncbi:MAG: BREX-6 system BrxE protein, partial [Sandaracinaceae bacterium]|nr:BREX-6 system BrxE protein [Sandaracinaceae bacterium]
MLRLPGSDLDTILALQLTVAWAGERNAQPPRLPWWRTDILDEAGARDLLSRLTPRTQEWAALEAVRQGKSNCPSRSACREGGPRGRRAGRRSALSEWRTRPWSGRVPTACE